MFLCFVKSGWDFGVLKMDNGGAGGREMREKGKMLYTNKWIFSSALCKRKVKQNWLHGGTTGTTNVFM